MKAISSDDSFDRVARAVREYDEHLNVNMMRGPGGQHDIRHQRARHERRIFDAGFSGNACSGTRGAGPHVRAGMQAANLTSQRHRSTPLAKQARISGVVKFAVVIARDGSMADIKVISGHPLLIPAALEAVKGEVQAHPRTAPRSKSHPDRRQLHVVGPAVAQASGHWPRRCCYS
jgi:hypothetical protein